ncbi:hypothetical protein [Streptobacillus moniliformis]|uniref:hypothetical protein n=1 Tax=Streptobacillus moniliformis TaxID=34105 RepID=UPI0007E48560|nr:hypothetical protein [Streptobacillus moniliformis]
MGKNVEFIYSSSRIAWELDMSLKKFLSLVNAGVYDFAFVEKLNNGKKRYHYDVVKTKKYINDYKEEKLRSKKLEAMLES